MLPTRSSAYDDLGFECPPTGQVVVLPPEERERAVAIAEERAPNLQEVLNRNSEALAEYGIEQQQTFGTERSTAAITYGDQQEPLDYDPDESPKATMLAVATPVDIDFSREVFDKALSGPGVIVGALFGVDEPLLLQLADGNEFVIEPGANFAVKWQASEGQEVEWYLVGESGDEQFVGVVKLEDLVADPDAKREDSPVSRPSVTIELGTCYVKYRIDWYRAGAYIKNSSLSWYVDLIQTYGGEILWWSCWP